MARATITLTNAWQQIAAGAAIITVKQSAEGQIWLNNQGADANAMIRSADAEHQFQQTENIATYAKGEDYIVIVDGVL